MQIQINPHSLLNLEHICEVLYKLHPSVLNYLVEMERSLGDILGFIDLKNPSLKEREFLASIAEGYNLTMNEEQKKQLKEFIDGKDVKSLEKLLREKKLYP